MISMREKGFYRGVDLGGWLSQCDYSEDRYNNFITEKDFEVVKSWGLDHVRIPVDYNLVEDAEGNYKEEGFARLQKAIDWCRKYGLHMILDLHKTFGFSFDIGENETGFFENEEYMERANINPPAIVRFKALLRNRGVDVPSNILSIEDLAGFLSRRKKK